MKYDDVATRDPYLRYAVLMRLTALRDEAVTIALCNEGRIPPERAGHYVSSWTPRSWWEPGVIAHVKLKAGSNKPIIRVRAYREH